MNVSLMRFLQMGPGKANSPTHRARGDPSPSEAQTLEVVGIVWIVNCLDVREKLRKID